MKYKIEKLQQGGGFATFVPVVNSAPTPPSGYGQKASDKEGSEGLQTLIDKKMYDALVTKGGLVNDVNAFVDKLGHSSKDPMSFMSPDNITSSLETFKDINRIRQNSEYWDSTYAQAKASGGLGEVAVGKQGELFVKDNGSFKTISTQEYTKHRGKYNPLTVAELLKARKFDPALTENNAIFQVGESAVGTKEILKRVEDSLHLITADHTKTERHYSKDDLQTQLNQLGLVKNPTAVEKEAIAKLVAETTEKKNMPGEQIKEVNDNTSKQRYKQIAWNYIQGALTREEKNKLNAVAAMNGTTMNGLLEGSLTIGLSGETHISELSPEKVGAGETDSEGSKKTIPLSPQELFHNDRLYRPGMTYDINGANGKVLTRATATAIGPLYSLTKEGGVIGSATVPDILTKGNYAAILDQKNAFIGDVKIDPMSLPEVAYTGDNVAKVYLPVLGDGTPDMGQMSKFNDAYQVFNINKDKWSDDEIKRHFAQAGFKNINIQKSIGSDGTISKVIAENNSVKPFLALPIITNSASDISDNPWMVEMMGEEKKMAKALMEESFTIAGGTPSKPTTKNRMPTGMFSLEDPYKGTLFVAYRPEASAMLSSTQGHLIGKPPTETDLYRNLNHSTAAYQNIDSSADPLKN